MTSRDFCYWLQGLFELSDPKTLDEKQTDLIRRHLAMVFLHEIDPSAGPPEHQADLNDAHGGLPKLSEEDVKAALKDAAQRTKPKRQAQTQPEHEPAFCPHSTLIRC